MIIFLLWVHMAVGRNLSVGPHSHVTYSQNTVTLLVVQQTERFEFSEMHSALQETENGLVEWLNISRHVLMIDDLKKNGELEIMMN
jgi:hypothetical protein